jgi:phytoene dehydrogenase-like protein
VRGGVFHTLPAGLVSLLTTGLLSAREKLETARLLSALRTIDTPSLHSVPICNWLEDRIVSEGVRDLTEALVRVATYTDDPEVLSAGAALEQVRRALHGVLYLNGGWQTLVDGLRKAAVTAGVHIVKGCEVVEVLRDPEVRGVLLEDGAQVRAAAVLLAGSPQMAAALTSKGEPSVLARWAESASPVLMSSLDVAVEVLPSPRARVAFGIDEPLYASVHSAVSHLAPQGGALIHVARYGGLRGESPAAVERQLSRFLEGLQPGWRKYMVRQRFLPHLVVANAVVTAAQGGLAGRPGTEAPDIPGLFLAGDWVGPEGMLADAGLASARAAARAITSGGGSRGKVTRSARASLVTAGGPGPGIRGREEISGRILCLAQ